MVINLLNETEDKVVQWYDNFDSYFLSLWMNNPELNENDILQSYNAKLIHNLFQLEFETEEDATNFIMKWS